jgi:hypothetical protein
MAPGLHDLQQSMRRSLIMGGEAVNGGPHPWVVSLQHRNFHFCGGTLLDEWHVLTAAHCETHVRCTGDTCEGVDVNIRRHNISLLAEDEFPGCSVVLRSALWVSHPQYSGSPRHLHDIAIIRLRDPVPDVAVGCRPYGLMRTTKPLLHKKGQCHAAKCELRSLALTPPQRPLHVWSHTTTVLHQV